MVRSTPIDDPAVNDKQYLPQIDALRGIAAMSVVFFHLYTGVYPHAELRPLMIAADLRSHPDIWRWIAVPSLCGYAGVPLFFVISGFCIHLAFLNSSRPFAFMPFMGRRFWRIYPAYVLAIALSLILPGNPIWKTHHLPKSLILHLLFLHNMNQTTNLELSGPFWTLAVEFQFYCAYPIFLFVRRRLGIGYATLAAMCLCMGVSFAVHIGWLSHFSLQCLPLMFWVQWCLGALIAERFFDGRDPLINLSLAILVWTVGVLFAVPVGAYSECNFLAWAILAGAVIERWIRRKADETDTNIASQLLVWLGMISYSIYLLHAIILSQILPRIPISGPRFMMVLLTVLPVVITSSVISYYLIERPGIMIGRKCVAMFFPKQSPAQVIKPEATGVHPGLRSS